MKMKENNDEQRDGEWKKRGLINKLFTFQLSEFIIHTKQIIKSFNDINLNCHLI